MSNKKNTALIRRASGLMALEQRFMFDGAAVADAMDQAIDLQVLAPAAMALNESMARAEIRAEQLVTEFLARPDAREQLFAMFSGAQSGTEPNEQWQATVDQLLTQAQQGDLHVRVELRSAAELQGAKGAFSATGTIGEPTIYLNADWVASADSESVSKVLVEEIGHYLDNVINGDADSAGDEGEVFLRFVVDGASPLSVSFALTDNDHAMLTLDGQQVTAELASFNFVGAYEMVYDLNNNSTANGSGAITGGEDNTERWAAKEQNLHYFNASTQLGVVRINDGSNGVNFSGNDVSAIAVVINGTTHYGWISRPIKANGVVRGFYFWTDTRFTSLALAQADGNQDGDSTILNNRGFVFVVDQSWFNTQINSGSISTINNPKDGSLGSITVANVGSSSDRVDSALNSVMVPNSAPAAANDILTVGEDSAMTTVAAPSGLLSNDSDANNDALTITSFTVGGTTTTLSSNTGTYTIANTGTITIRSDGSYDFTPASNYNGSLPPITYTVSDGNGGSSTAILSITVTPVNDPPISTNDVVSTTVNTPKVLSVNDFGNYSDVDNDPLSSVQITALPGNGTLQYWTGSAWASVTTNQTFTTTQILQGTLRFNPDQNETGDGNNNDLYTTLQFKVSDGNLLSVSAYTLTVQVTGALAPVANADTNSVTEAGCNVNAAPATGNVITGDTSGTGIKTVTEVTAYGNSLSVSAGSTSVSGGRTINGQYGSLVIGANGSYSYTLNNGLSAIDAMNSGDTKTEIFSYTLNDGQGGTATTTLTLTINGTNDAPVGKDDFASFEEGANQSSGNFGKVTVAANGALANDSDVDNNNNQLTVKLVDGTTPGSANPDVILNASSPISAVTMTVTQISGNWNAIVPTSPAQPVWLNVALTNAALDKQGNQLTVYRGGSQNSPTLVFSDNVALYNYENTDLYIQDPGNSQYTNVRIDITSATTSSSTVVSTTSSVTGIAVGYAVTGAGIPTGVTVTSVDTANKTVTLSQAVNLANTSLTFSDPNTVSIDSSTQEYFSGTYGYLVLNQTGGYTYTLTTDLTSGQVVTEQFTYTVADPANGCTGTAKINIRVFGTDAPELVNDTLVVSEDSGNHVTLNNVSSTSSDSVKTNDVAGTTVTLNDVTSFKIAGDATTYSAGNTATIPGVGTLSIAANGAVTFDPVNDYLGPVPAVTYTRLGSDSQSYTANLIITIQPVDDASVLAADTLSVPEDGSGTGNVLANDSDVDNTLSVASFTIAGMTGTQSTGTAITVTDGNGPVGSLTLNANGSYTFTPAANWTGTVPVITYTTNTGSTSTLTITVTPVNDPPALDLDQSGSGTGFAATYTNAASAISIGDTDVLITDISASVSEDTHMESATIVLTNPQTSDALNVGTLPSGITVASGPTLSNGVITLTLTGHATLADYQTAIKAITFSSTGNSTVDRVISVKVNDGDVDSNTAYTTITVNPDARPVTVLGTVVNEASSYVMFEVAGAEGQWISLALGVTGSGAGHASSGTDFLPNLEYFNGTNWVNYTGGLVQIPDLAANNGKLLVRTPVLQDTAFETTASGYETLKLTAYNAAGTSNAITGTVDTLVEGMAQIRDDGQGSIFLGNNNGSNNALAPNTTGDTDPNGPDYPTYLDDDRPVTVNSLSVNEGSPKAVFTVTGNAGQIVRLALTDRTATIENGTSPVATDGSEDYGPGLQIWNGSTWVNYTPGNDFTLTASETYVRTAIVDDDPYEGQHSFVLGVTRQSAGANSYGTANIYDDGTGSYWIGDATAPATDGELSSNNIVLDDDRTLTISASGPVNEGSTYAMFTVTAVPNESLDLNLQAATSGAAATRTGFTFEYSTDGSTWTTYDANHKPSPGADGKVYVRVDISSESDSSYEGAETFALKASYTTNTSKNAAADTSIVDDGTGAKYGPNVDPTNGPNTITTNLDDDRDPSVDSVTVNEASDWAVFKVSSIAGCAITGFDIVQGTANIARTADTSIQYWNNGWTDTALSGMPLNLTAGASVLVRVSITSEQDQPYEVSENFQLKVITNGPAGTVYGTGTIKDDGTGTIFTNGDPNGLNPATDSDGPFDDDRPLTVSSVTVNEGSPYAVFTVTGAANQLSTLGLSGQNTDGANLIALQYFDGTTWQPYTSGTVALNSGGSLLVRVALSPEQEAALDGPETFNLVATNTGGTAASGVGTIVDDGTGSYFAADNNSATSNVPNGVILDDDRPLTVSSVTVNEGSPYAVFTVTGAANQLSTLSLSGQNTDGANLSALQYFDGTTWQPYSSGTVALNSSGSLLVRVALSPEQEAALDGPETFNLVATNTGGTAASGVGTIFDDGTGSYFAADNNSATSNVPNGVLLDDDRAITVSGLDDVSEGSNAIFTVTLPDGNTRATEIALALSNGSGVNDAEANDYSSSFTAYYFANGTKTELTISNGKITLPAGVTSFFVSVPTTQDTDLEGSEDFSLTATITGGKSAADTSTIKDDGTGRIYNDQGASPTGPGDDDRAITVSGLDDVSEGSNAIFTVTLPDGNTRATEIALALSNGSGANDAEANDYSSSFTAYYYANGTKTELTITNGKITLPAGVTSFFVSVPTTQDTDLEGAEDFSLTATITGGKSAADTSTIKDDGTGNIYDDQGLNPVGPGDDDRPKPAVAMPPPMPAPAAPAAPAPEVAQLPPLFVPPQAFASALTPLAPALVPAEPPAPLGDAVTSRSGVPIPVSETAAPGLNLYQGITDQFVQSTDTTSKVSLPFDAFIHSNKDAVIKLQAKQADDSNLPNWVQFDATSGVFEVTPPKGFKGKLDLKVIARDDDGREAVAIFQMFIGEQTTDRPQSRDSFTDKLRMAGNRPVTLVRVVDTSRAVAAPATVREAPAVKAVPA